MKSVRNYLKTSAILMVLFLSSCSDYLDTEPTTEETYTNSGGIIIKEERADIFNFRNSKNDAYFGVYGKGMRFDDEYGRK